MSFLLKGRKIFLFVFLFCTLLTPTQSVFSQEPSNLPMTGTPWIDAVTKARATGDNSHINEYKENAPSLMDKTLNKLFGSADWMLKAMFPVFELISKILLTIAAIILGVASFIFDMFISIGVVGISDVVNAGGADSPVKKAWEIFRNIANVGLIFVVIFIAIGTILQVSGYEGKKLLGRVIIAALLMNFSFFFGAIVVDISNEMSLTVYDEIKELTGAGSNQSANLGSYIWKNSGVAVFTTAAEKDVDGNTSGIFESTASASLWTGIQRIPIVAAFNINGATDKIIYNATSSALGALAALILAIVLIVASGQIMGRMIAILLLLVVSPIAFMSMILPSTQKVSSDWWRSIIGHSFYLPAFLLFIYVGLKILGVFQKIDINKYIEGINNSGTAQNGLAETIKIMTMAGFAMGITIGLFVAALIVAKKISDGGSAAVGKISASVTSGIGGAAMAGGAFLGRNTLGRSADALSKTEFGQRLGSTRIGSYALDGIKGVAKAGFDARSTKIFKGVASATGVGGDFNNNFASRKGGFVGQEKAAVEARLARAENLSADLSEAQIKEQERLQNGMSSMIDTDPRVITYKKRIEDKKTELEAATALGDATKMKALKAQIKASEKGLEIEEKRVKTTTAYETMQNDSDQIMSAKTRYGKSLEQPFMPGITNKAAAWIPFNARAADAGAAKKILKEKTDNEKLIDAIRESNKPTSP